MMFQSAATSRPRIKGLADAILFEVKLLRQLMCPPDNECEVI